MLHTLSHSPTQFDFTAFLRTVSSDDAVLLMQDAVLLGITPSHPCLTKLLNIGVPVYALNVDVSARGLGERLAESVNLIDYSGFVQLTEDHPQQILW